MTASGGRAFVLEHFFPLLSQRKEKCKRLLISYFIRNKPKIGGLRETGRV